MSQEKIGIIGSLDGLYHIIMKLKQYFFCYCELDKGHVSWIVCQVAQNRRRGTLLCRRLHADRIVVFPTHLLFLFLLNHLHNLRLHTLMFHSSHQPIFLPLQSDQKLNKMPPFITVVEFIKESSKLIFFFLILPTCINSYSKNILYMLFHFFFFLYDYQQITYSLITYQVDL